MDHQQNYEYSDPNSFGFINSFSSTDNFMLGQPHQGQQQQLNGKAHSELPLMAPIQSFDSNNSVPSTQYLIQPQPMMYHLPDTLEQPPQPTTHYPQSSIDYQHMTSIPPDMSLTSQKNSLFNLVHPPSAVPADIIQESELLLNQPEVLQSSLVVEQSPEQLTLELPSTSCDSKSIAETPQQTAIADETSAKQSTPVFNPAQNSMLKALGVVRKDILVPASGLKRRRRILQLNEDDSDEDNELKKQLLDDSFEKEKEKETEDSSQDSESDDPSLANDPSALKARSLLKSAVIIQGPDTKKKKKRVLESDDEEEMQTSVDDIGLIEPNELENEEESLSNDIIVSEATFNSNEGSENVSIESPTIIQNEFVVPPPPAPVKSEKVEEKLLEAEELVENNSQEPQANVKEENNIVKQEEVKSIFKTEDGDIDPSMSVEAILENIKPMADDDAFFKTDDKSDDSDVQFVSNDVYFGTPDTSKPQSSGNRRRGPRTDVRRIRNPNSSRRKRSNKYEKDFVEGSSESEDTSYSESSVSSSESSGAENVRQKARQLIRKSPIIVQTKSFSVTRVPFRKKIAKKDRFYDKSRDIPNDVYFGDVNVPLHVLHTRWDAEAESSDSSGENRLSQSKSVNLHRFTNFTSSNNSRPTFNYIEQSDDPKLSTLKEFAKMSGIKINYARLFNGVRSTDDKCMMIRRILAQKGLQGEPTIAKCKQLRLDLQAKRESAELDKSLIIRSEGRTRRATRNVSSKSPFLSQPSTSSAVIQPETLQTLSKIRRVVDSDSE